ncbi:patatin-like phospholipase domain-containing protein 2 isoform X2 [Aethina tumida]|uniref:patatin-like phospholipase domain-containing protein 2 isoform X2 n=1 Tax=Aethina tumida TaxID=116153 RepID=UPI00096AE52B|nr:patatin-like phospholipase domain-containing protein 2 isoform X2 [Aethina tumida]
MNLSFAGCGFLGIYHVGVASCFRKYAPHLLLNKISGASIGAIAASAMLCDLSLGDVTSNILSVAIEARKKSLGPFNPTFNVHNLLRDGLEKFLPEDAHHRVNGKLHVSLTRWYDGKNVIVSHFDSREELIEALLASAFIPLFSGIFPPKFKGVRYVDGGCSDNLPTLDENTITVSPFCGESDICPRDDSSQLFHINIANTSIELSKYNMYRLFRILFPPQPEILSNMCKQGFDDALRFLHRNNLINCTRCLAVQSTFVVSDTVEDHSVYDPHCSECKMHRQEALVSNMPDTVLSIFQEAIDTANKGLLNWVFKHRGMKLLSVLSLPYTLPVDIVYATFTKLMVAAPQLGNGVWEVSKYFMDQMGHVLYKVNKKRQQLSAKITCQLAITEYGANKYDVESCQDLNAENKMNLNFTLNLDNSDLPLTQSPQRKIKNMLQRKPSLTISKTDTMDNDTFEHILQITSQQDTIMAYYYLDENNKVKVTEIFDLTDAESPIVQTKEEKHLNNGLQFDDEWDDSSFCEHADDLDSQYSLEDVLEGDACNMFSDPESEWTATCKVEEPDDYLHAQNSSDDLKPESEQANISDYYRNYKIPTFTFDEIDP